MNINDIYDELVKRNVIVIVKITNVIVDKSTGKKISIFTSPVINVLGCVCDKNDSKNVFDMFMKDNKKRVINIKNVIRFMRGVINEENIYDKTFTYLNETIDNNIKEGNCIVALIHSVYSNNNKLNLTLLNSYIHNKEQIIFSNVNDNNSDSMYVQLKYFLGEVVDSDINEIGDGCYLENKLKQYNIVIRNEQKEFPFNKLRKVQNYEWSDVYVSKAKEEIEKKNYQKAIEYLNEAECLDPLNVSVFEKKIEVFNVIGNNKEVKKNCKKLLVLEPDNEYGIRMLRKVIKVIGNGKKEEKYV